MSQVRLNIGAGSTVIEGFTPIDRKFGSEAYPLLAYEDNSVEEIRASHVLEHFDFKEMADALAEWVRVLKPGGKIRIAVPDARKLALMMDFPDHDETWRFMLMGGQTDQNDYHRSCFTETTLRKYMQQAGLVDIAPWTSRNTDTASHPVSLNLEGRKPMPEENVQEVKICAMLSIPRVGWNDHWGSVLEALSPFRIPTRRFTGAFWGQCMQRGLNECLEDGIDWVLTLDYDSVFTAQHLDEMLGIFGSHPEIDALAALQCRRSGATPLATVADESLIEQSESGPVCRIDGGPIKAYTAHFGMTLLRVDALRDVEKPWFKGQPDANGDWGDGRLDDDIWFWHQWRKAGKSVYFAPSVRIGHLEVMVREFTPEMQMQCVTVPEWRTANGLDKSQQRKSA